MLAIYWVTIMMLICLSFPYSSKYPLALYTKVNHYIIHILLINTFASSKWKKIQYEIELIRSSWLIYSSLLIAFINHPCSFIAVSSFIISSKGYQHKLTILPVFPTLIVWIKTDNHKCMKTLTKVKRLENEFSRHVLFNKLIQDLKMGISFCYWNLIWRFSLPKIYRKMFGKNLATLSYALTLSLCS